MDRATLERHLVMAEGHVRSGAEHLAQQREIVAKLERDGRDTKIASDLLRTFEEMQDMHVADRDRIAAEIDALGSE